MHLVASEHYQQLKASGLLPSPKGVAFAIIKLLQRDDYRLNDLVQLVQSDPAIAGRLLKFANAASFGNGRPIASISKAVTVLGAFRVRDLVLGFSVLHSHRHGNCPQFDYPRFWSRALATAIAAQALASFSQIAAEENFTAGLLCGVGELALASLFPDDYGEILGVSRVDERLVLEQAAFGTDHRELGATLLMEWGLPEPLVLAIYHCASPDEAGFPDGSRNQILTFSLHIALTLAEICVAPHADRWIMIPELFSKAAKLGIGTEELTTLADGITASWNDWGRILEIRTHDIPSFADMLSSSPPRNMEGMSPVPSLIKNQTALMIGVNSQESSEISSYLKASGFTVLDTSNGTDGLVIALRESPELIFLEMASSEADGIAFCRALRDSPLGRDAHIILIGYREDEKLLIDMLDAGADDFILRPITVNTLRARLRTVGKVIQLQEAIRRERNDLVRSAGEWAGTHRRLMQVAMTDPLTRLPNRRHGMDFLSAEWVFAISNNLSLACLMVDIDYFKKINDCYGHEAGDTVLVSLAKLLQASARSEDMAFRFGGEEFCVICPGADLSMAGAIAERIRQNAASSKHQHGTQEIVITVSIGVAAMTPTLANSETLISAADAALYRAKENGRNRVEYSDRWLPAH